MEWGSASALVALSGSWAFRDRHSIAGGILNCLDQAFRGQFALFRVLLSLSVRLLLGDRLSTVLDVFAVVVLGFGHRPAQLVEGSKSVAEDRPVLDSNVTRPVERCSDPS